MYDTIIIGAGLSGLMNAYILAKEGQKVCVVEKQKKIGGSIQNFKRDGVVFDTGAHYVGGLDKGQNLYRYFKYFNLIQELNVKQLDKDAFDIIKLGEKQFSFAQGADNFIEKLSNSFPNDSKEIRKYIDTVKTITGNFPLFNPDIPGTPILKNLSDNVVEHVKSLTTNKLLQNVLLANNMLYMGGPEISPFFLHAIINYGYIESAWRVVGGSQQIADILANNIKNYGGEIFTKSKVSKIKVKNKTFNSIEINNEKTISGKALISTIHPSLTLSLIEKGTFRKSYTNRISNIKNTDGSFTVYIVFKEKSFPYINSNYYLHDTENVWNTSTNYSDRSFGSNLFFMSHQDKNNENFAESAVAMTNMKFSDVKKWEHTRVRNRGNEYEDFKKQKAEVLLNYVQKHFPGIRRSIKNIYTSTPLTYRDYTGTKEGSAYGTLKNCNKIYETMILPVTKIKNLFLSGQNINIHGVHGVAVGSVITCSNILGHNYLLNRIRKA